MLWLSPSHASAQEAETTPLHPAWAPLVVPASIFAPGLGQLLRGERRAGGTMLAVGGVALGLSAGAGLFLLTTGASDVSAAIGVPIGLLGISTLLTLALTDVAGAFGSGPPPSLTDTWNARTRVAVSLFAPMRSHDAEPTPELHASWRGERWLVEGRVSTTPNGAGPWLEGTAGFRVFGYTEQSPHAGLWVEAGARGGFGPARTLRSRVQLVSALPMGLFGERFSRLTSVLRLGVDPTWVWYPGPARPSVEVVVSGGFEVRFVASQTLRLTGGYEHARDGLVGGFGTGFIGTFNAGMELVLAPELFLIGRAHLGTPNGFTVGLEWRR